MKIKLIIIITFIALLVSGAYAGYKLIKERKDNQRLRENLASYDTKYTDLNLTAKETALELSKSKSEYRVVDSLLNAEKAKPKQVKQLYIAKTSISIKDTSFVANKTILDKREKLKTKLYKTLFQDNRNCMKIEGYVMSTDSAPAIAITSQNAEIETYDLTIARKWFQFWKPKEKKITYTKCGNYRVIRINRTQ